MGNRWQMPLIVATAVTSASMAWGQSTLLSEQEIGHLLDYVNRSACRFQRNGTTYSGPEAFTHLQRKYRYLNNRDAVPDAATFIDRAATASSISGAPYQVQCDGQPALPTNRWLNEELGRYRLQQNGTSQRQSR